MRLAVGTQSLNVDEDSADWPRELVRASPVDTVARLKLETFVSMTLPNSFVGDVSMFMSSEGWR